MVWGIETLIWMCIFLLLLGYGYMTDTKTPWDVSNGLCTKQGFLANQENSQEFCRNRIMTWPQTYWSGVFRSVINNLDRGKIQWLNFIY